VQAGGVEGKARMKRRIIKETHLAIGGYEVRQVYQTTALYLRFVACLASFSTDSLLPVSVIRMQNYRQRIVDDKSGRINFLDFKFDICL
jgi:hypothetical protein